MSCFHAHSTKLTAAVVGEDTSSARTSKFHDLVEQGDLESIRRWMATAASPRLCSTTGRFVKTIDVNQTDPGRAGATALHIASRRGLRDVVEVSPSLIAMQCCAARDV